MRVHRFFAGGAIKLKKSFWLRDESLLWQWNKVLRFREGQEVVLFDGNRPDSLYRITKISKSEAHLELVEERELKLPPRSIYLFWSLLKKDNNELIIQKCTELGVSVFVPLLSDRSIRDNFNLGRAEKIALEASEQCGRSSLPVVQEPLSLRDALDKYLSKVQIFVCEQGSSKLLKLHDYKNSYGVLIGPEGGWSDVEKQLFEDKKLDQIHISDFTLRAETAAIVASSKLL